MELEKLRARFEAKFERGEPDECWEWQAAKTHGYGALRVGGRRGRTLRAHRISYELANGPIPAGMLIDHICHNPACVNPDHLRLATRKQNGEHRSDAGNVNSTSGVRGVHWHKAGRKWMAELKHNKRTCYLGLFADRADAEAAVIAKRNELFTHNDLDRLPDD